MKDKTQKSFRGIVRILLLVFCYTFGSHAFALALEHEQTVETYKVTDVPNPRNESSSNWVSNPNQILDESYVWEINNMLSQLEDSLSIEVAIVALSSIGEDIPAEFAHKLFEHWGIGKKADDNGLLILLVLDQRKVTFATGYGLEGVLPDALCFRIQQNEMVPWFRKNDFDRGMTEGVRAVTLVLYGSDYEPVSQSTSDNYWKSASNTLWTFYFNTLYRIAETLTLDTGKCSHLSHESKQSSPQRQFSISSNQSPDTLQPTWMSCIVFSGLACTYCGILMVQVLPKTTCYFAE